MWAWAWIHSCVLNGLSYTLQVEIGTFLPLFQHDVFTFAEDDPTVFANRGRKTPHL